MGKTDNFFDKKRPWSELKDGILSGYLKPYLAKISKTRCPIIIVDCFAGKGKFDSGEEGSPLYIANAIKEHLTQNTSNVKGIFVENKYFNKLKENLNSFTRCELIKNDYEKWADDFIKSRPNKKTNLLFYCDPYGIKHLPFSYFKRICSLNLNSFEVLLNFNSFGFLREGCRLLQINGFDSIDDDVYELDGANSIERMNAIAEGNYWIEILKKYDEKNLKMSEAEKIFTEKYIIKMRSIFKHVVNIPIKVKSSNLPKYRLIFGTNSEDGILLVADKMSRTWKDFISNERKGQQSFFNELDFPDATIVGTDKPENEIIDLLDNPQNLKTLLVKLIEKYEINYSESELKQCLKDMEADGKIIVTRNPSKTPTGKLSTAWDYNNINIEIKRGESCQKSLL